MPLTVRPPTGATLCVSVESAWKGFEWERPDESVALEGLAVGASWMWRGDRKWQRGTSKEVTGLAKRAGKLGGCRTGQKGRA